VKEAAAQGRDLMERVVRQVEDSLALRLQRSSRQADRQELHEAIELLSRHKARLIAAYPQALLQEFAQSLAGAPAPRGGSQSAFLSFSELELVDDDKVQESVELVRTQQSVAVAVEAELVPLNALVCAAQGLRAVRNDANPLRPEAYVRSLRQVLQESPVPQAVRLRWLQYLGEALGPQLAQVYRELVVFLRMQGVSEAGFQIVPGTAPARGGATGLTQPGLSVPGLTVPGVGAPAPRGALPGRGGQPPSTLLTVRGLQRLLAGEPADGAAPAPAEPAEPGSGFAETLPAAVEVLQQMRGVESVMQRLRARQGTGGSAEQLREALRAEVHRPGQAVALEVVALMVENIAGDERLLPAVREAVRQLEPALLRLALADPRFFSDRRHPARRLLDEMTGRSLAWQAESEAGFDAFIAPLREAVEALVETRVEGAEPYEFALQTLEDAWNRGQSRERRQREKAVRALLQAEQRNLLASRVAQEIEARADLALAPPVVIAFLLGPWTQVVARAQLADTDGQSDPGGYRAVVPELLWSVLPHTTAAAAGRLARHLPALLDALRKGLGSIGYAQVQIRRFLDRLAVLHQTALKGQPAQAADAAAIAAGQDELQQLLGPNPMADDGWLAPDEARSTGFMDSLPGSDRPLFQATQPGSGPAPIGADGPELPLNLQPGSWIELQSAEGGWSRWQVWISPHRTLLMLSGPGGRTQSLTPKLATAMAQNGQLRTVTAGRVVDSALDAVAGAALRNEAGFDPGFDTNAP
jgi:hypothetical protein